MDFSPAISPDGLALTIIFVAAILIIFVWLGAFQFDTALRMDIFVIIFVVTSFFIVLFPVSNYSMEKERELKIKCYNLWQEFREDDSLVNYLKWEKECN